MDQQNILRKLRHTLNQAQSTNLYDIAKSQNIIILESNLGSICGFYTYLKKTRVILLNENLPELQKQMVLSHEIGHAVLHTKVNWAFIKKYTQLKARIYEKEADYFGAQLLKAIGMLEEEGFCIHESELAQEDLAFLECLIAL